MRSVVCLWSCVVLVWSSMGCAIGDQDVFEECLHREVCVEDDGIAKTEDCFSMLSKTDQDFFLKQFAHYYGELDSPSKYIEVSCESRKKAKEAIDYYYDKKMEKDNKGENPSKEERKKLVEARGCIMLMIEECRTKREMGLYTD